MPAVADFSWVASAIPALVGALCGFALRHWWGVYADRASAARIVSLCDQLDSKDGKLQSLRNELEVMQARALAFQSGVETRHAAGAATNSAAMPFDGHPERAARMHSGDDTLRLEDNEDAAFFKRRVRALEGHGVLGSVASHRSG